MTPYMQVDGLTKSFGDLVLFRKISFGVAGRTTHRSDSKERYRQDYLT